jgi:hypothetical protein
MGTESTMKSSMTAEGNGAPSQHPDDLALEGEVRAPYDDVMVRRRLKTSMN